MAKNNTKKRPAFDRKLIPIASEQGLSAFKWGVSDAIFEGEPSSENQVKEGLGRWYRRGYNFGFNIRSNLDNDEANNEDLLWPRKMKISKKELI